jgi:hypothetical protein
MPLDGRSVTLNMLLEATIKLNITSGVCCAVGSAHRRGTLSEPFALDVLVLEKKKKLSDFGISDKVYRTVLLIHISTTRCMRTTEWVQRVLSWS